MPFATLQNILMPEYLEIQPDDSHNILLSEPQNGNKNRTLKKVTITDLPEKVIAIRLEPLKNNLFYQDGQTNNGYDLKRYRCKCDYILIAEIDQKGYIFYIEMKSSNIDEHAKFQILRGRCVLEYLRFTLQNVSEIKDALKDYEDRYVVLCKIPMEGGLTNPKRQIFNSLKPDKANTTIDSIYPFDVGISETVSIKELIYEPDKDS